jgi:hypothetical protein
MTKHIIKLEEIKIEPNGYHLLVSAYIGKKQIFLILDTGASQSIFNIDADVFTDIEKTKVEENRKSSGINAPLSGILEGIIPEICFSDYLIKNMETLFMPFHHINEIYKEYINYTIDGIIGGDFLNTHNAIIDYSKMELLLHIN